MCVCVCVCVMVCTCVCTSKHSVLYARAGLRILFRDDSPECSLSAVKKIMSKIESTHEFGLCCAAR